MHLHLHRQQGRAFTSAATEILYGGAAGGGKSHLMRAAAIIWCVQIPGLQVYLFRRTHPDLVKNHMEGPSSLPVLLSELVQSGEVRINYGDGYILFKNGSRINLCHCQYDKDVYNYQGAEIHVLMIDELTHFTEKMYRFLRGRCRMVGVPVPKEMRGKFPRIINGANPGGVGHTWVKAAFIDQAPPMVAKRMPRSDGGMLRQFIPAKLADNPTMARDDPSYSERLEGLGDPSLIQAMRDGNWNIVAGGMFDDVWTGVEKPATDIPRGWRLSRSFDWGSSKPFSVCWWAEADGTATRSGWCPKRGSWVMFAEWYGWNGKANEGARMTAAEIGRGILAKEAEMGVAGRVLAGPADSAIFATENGNCIGDDFARVGVRWTPADKGPGSRMNGWETMRRLMRAAGKSPQEEPGLFIFDTCRHAIRTIPALPRDERKPEDVDTHAEDHVGDAVRYRVGMPSRQAGAVNVPGM